MPSPEQDLLTRARSRLGTTLKSKYRLEDLLGVGGMAAVYSATHRNAKRVAVKVLHSQLSLHEDARTRFLREGYVANSVGHPGAVAVLDDDLADDGAAFLVMELLEGETLDTLHKRLGPRLPVRLALAIARGVLDVLAAAHAKAIIHRDIKPANLFLTCDGQVKVLDFGVARMRDATSSNPTHSGLTLGTPAFMAPEQAIGRSEVDGRADVWAVGATLFTFLAGQQVHGSSSGQETLIWAATRPAPPLASLVPEVPAAVAKLVDKALAFAVEARWETAAAMRDAVDAAFTEVEGEPIPATVLRAIAIARPHPERSPPSPAPGGAPLSDVHDLPTLSTPNANAKSLAGVAAQPPAPAPRTRHVAAGAVVAAGVLVIALGVASRVRLTPPAVAAGEAGSPVATASSPPPVVPMVPPARPEPVAAASASGGTADAPPVSPRRALGSPRKPPLAPVAPPPKPSPPREPFDRQ